MQGCRGERRIAGPSCGVAATMWPLPHAGMVPLGRQPSTMLHAGSDWLSACKQAEWRCAGLWGSGPFLQTTNHCRPAAE